MNSIVLEMKPWTVTTSNHMIVLWTWCRSKQVLIIDHTFRQFTLPTMPMQCKDLHTEASMSHFNKRIGTGDQVLNFWLWANCLFKLLAMRAKCTIQSHGPCGKPLRVFISCISLEEWLKFPTVQKGVEYGETLIKNHSENTKLRNAFRGAWKSLVIREIVWEVVSCRGGHMLKISWKSFHVFCDVANKH